MPTIRKSTATVRLANNCSLGRSLLSSAFILAFLAIQPTLALSCQIEYSDWIIGAFRHQGMSLDKRVGHFANLSECDAALRQAVSQSGDPTLANHMRCVDCLSEAPLTESPTEARRRGDLQSNPRYRGGGKVESPPASSVDPRPQMHFEAEKKALLTDLKGGSSALKLRTSQSTGSGLALKAGSPPPAKPASGPGDKEQKVREAQRRITELKKDVAGIQGLLRQYTRSLANNVAQFDIWGKTVDEAYSSVLNNSKEYVLGLFMDDLLARTKAFQKASPGGMDRFINPSDSGMRAWLGKELGGRKVHPERLEKLVKLGLAEGDLAALVNTEDGLRKNLDALILFSDLLDVADRGAFKNLPFQHARMIGETYSDLASICYSWFSIDQLEKDTDKLAGEVDSLSLRMRHVMKEMDCLNGCVENYSDRCMEKCSGKTRLHSPPPLPR